MASVNIEKYHGSEGSMVLGHMTRWDGREDVKYKNEHIDPNMGYLNSVILADESYQHETSKQTYERLKNRVHEIDKIEPPKRIRKDRVTMVSIEVPCPYGVDEEKFFRIAMEEFTKMCGNDSRNVSNMFIHRDEVHDYMDCSTKQMRTSMVHGHMMGIPYVDGKGVNGKAWATKKSLSEINRVIDKRCRKELGVAFLDGTGEKSKATVEQLKIASLKTIQKEIDKGQTAKKQLEPYIVASNYEPKTKKNLLGQNIISNEDLFNLMKTASLVDASRQALDKLNQSEKIIANKESIIDNAKIDAKAYRQKANKQGKQIINEAQGQAEQILFKASEQSKQIINKANKKSNQIIHDAETEVNNRLEQEIKNLQNEIRDLQNYEIAIQAIQSYLGDKWNNFWTKVIEHWQRKNETKRHDKDIPDR